MIDCWYDSNVNDNCWYDNVNDNDFGKKVKAEEAVQDYSEDIKSAKDAEEAVKSKFWKVNFEKKKKALKRQKNQKPKEKFEEEKKVLRSQKI